MKKWFKKIVNTIMPKPPKKHPEKPHTDHQAVFIMAKVNRDKNWLWVFAIIAIALCALVLLACEKQEIMCPDKEAITMYEGD